MTDIEKAADEFAKSAGTEWWALSLEDVMRRSYIRGAQYHNDTRPADAPRVGQSIGEKT